MAAVALRLCEGLTDRTLLVENTGPPVFCHWSQVVGSVPRGVVSNASVNHAFTDGASRPSSCSSLGTIQISLRFFILTPHESSATWSRAKGRVESVGCLRAAGWV